MEIDNCKNFSKKKKNLEFSASDDKTYKGDEQLLFELHEQYLRTQR